MPSRPQYKLTWIPTAVANTLRALGIHNRGDFIRHFQWPRSTVYAMFNDDWSGIAPCDALAEICYRLRVPISLLAEPTLVRRNGRPSEEQDQAS
jgi:hypothetical protein